jgi:hypothetical protein
MHKLLLRIVGCIDFRHCPELGVRTEDRIHNSARPLDFAGLAVQPPYL